MKNEVWIGKKGLRYWYYHFRDSEYFSLVMMGITVLMCTMLLFLIVIPQLNSWFSIREETIATQNRIQILRNNIAFMNNLDRISVNKQMQIASTALPPEKDFESMLNSLSDAAVASAISLNDFSFQVGNVASTSGIVTDSRYKDVASIKITVVAVGTIQNVRKFLQNLENSLPLSEVVNIDGTGQSISVSIQFYQKAYPNVIVNADKPLQPLSAEKTILLQQLATWKQVQQSSSPAPSASGGAVPLF